MFHMTYTVELSTGKTSTAAMGDLDGKSRKNLVKEMFLRIFHTVIEWDELDEEGHNILYVRFDFRPDE